MALSLSAAQESVCLMLRHMSPTGNAMAHAILPGAAIGYLVAGLSLTMTIGGISTVTLATLALLHGPLVLECLDPGFLCQVGRWSPMAHHGFLALLVITLVAGFHALGTLVAVGIMVLPAATARFGVRRLGPLLLSTALALAASLSGLRF